MGFIIAMLVFLLLMNNIGKKTKMNSTSAVIVEVAPVCPPHKWKYQEIKDPEGNTIKYKLICDICGPLKQSDGPARLV